MIALLEAPKPKKIKGEVVFDEAPPRKGSFAWKNAQPKVTLYTKDQPDPEYPRWAMFCGLIFKARTDKELEAMIRDYYDRMI